MVCTISIIRLFSKFQQRHANTIFTNVVKAIFLCLCTLLLKSDLDVELVQIPAPFRLPRVKLDTFIPVTVFSQLLIIEVLKYDYC